MELFAPIGVRHRLFVAGVFALCIALSILLVRYSRAEETCVSGAIILGTCNSTTAVAAPTCPSATTTAMGAATLSTSPTSSATAAVPVAPFIANSQRTSGMISAAVLDLVSNLQSLTPGTAAAIGQPLIVSLLLFLLLRSLGEIDDVSRSRETTCLPLLAALIKLVLSRVADAILMILWIGGALVSAVFASTIGFIQACKNGEIGAIIEDYQEFWPPEFPVEAVYTEYWPRHNSPHLLRPCVLRRAWSRIVIITKDICTALATLKDLILVALTKMWSKIGSLPLTPASRAATVPTDNRARLQGVRVLGGSSSSFSPTKTRAAQRARLPDSHIIPFTLNSHVNVSLLAGLVGLSGWSFWLVFVYTVFANFFFQAQLTPLADSQLRSLRHLDHVAHPSSSSSAAASTSTMPSTPSHAQRARRIQFLFVIAAAQALSMGVLVRV
ncbi:hypothetical protein JCM8097_006749 [Rhodosporidiobolus ruineniae]